MGRGGYIGVGVEAGGLDLFVDVFVEGMASIGTPVLSNLQRAQSPESGRISGPETDRPHFTAFAPTLWPGHALRPQYHTGLSQLGMPTRTGGALKLQGEITRARALVRPRQSACHSLYSSFVVRQLSDYCLTKEVRGGEPHCF